MKRHLKFHNFRKVVLPVEQIVKAVTEYVSLLPEEGRAVYEEARKGNKVAQYIVGMSLLNASHRESGQAWLEFSAEQDFEPAKARLLRTG